MQFSRTMILVCATMCGAGLMPQRSSAGESPFTLDPYIPTAQVHGPSGQASGSPSHLLSLDQPVVQPNVEDSPMDEPIYACACGCGVFEVATSSMLPHGQGGMVWFEWDYQDQNHNRRGTSSAPAEDNDDKDIRTSFFNLGFQYFFNRSWGVQVEVPVDHRHFASDDGTFDWTALGDIRIKGLYTGFFEDQSLGIDFGVKLASGDFTHAGPDRDTQLGTGSTDILLGGFYRTNLSADHNWSFFAQIEGDLPVISQDHYRPGLEIDGAAGVYYSGLTFHGVTIAPVGQVILSYRDSDAGTEAAHPIASGYERVLLSPGIEFDFHPFSVYADVEIPVYQHFRGDQLAAPAMFKVIMSFKF